MDLTWVMLTIALYPIHITHGTSITLSAIKEPKPLNGSGDGIGISPAVSGVSRGRTHFIPGRGVDINTKLDKAPPSRPVLIWDQQHLKPQFNTSNSNKVVAAAERTVFLHCLVKYLGNRVVTWTRQDESDGVQVLTAGLYTYTTDGRYSAVHPEDSQDWSLRLVSSRVSDSGIYECQVSTEPKISRVFHLLVVDASAKIRGPKEVHMMSGSHINLTCAVRGSTEPPQYIYWYCGNTLINYSSRGGISVVTDKLSRTSRLVVTRATTHDSGNYTCVPANAQPSSVRVYILNGEHPAAVQGGQSTRVHCQSLGSLLLLGSTLPVFTYR